MLLPIEVPVSGEACGRLLVILLVLGLSATAPARAASETGIVLERPQDGDRVTVDPARIRQHLEPGDRIRIFGRSGNEHEMVLVAIGTAGTSELSGEYVATITGNRYTLRLRDDRFRVSLTQTGSRLSGHFDRERGRIWGEFDGERIRFEWVAHGGSYGRGEWRIRPDGQGLDGSWYSNWQGEGAWNMRRIDAPSGSRPGRAATLIGELVEDRIRIEVPLAAIERIRVVSRAAGSGGPGQVAPIEAGSGLPDGDPSTPPVDVADAAPADLWEGVGPGETGFELGALLLLGADISVYHRPAGSPWLFGFRYLETEDDFVTIDFDDSDKEETRISGPFARYLFTPGKDTYYLGGGIFEITQRVECPLGSDEDSATGLFVGGGYMGGRRGAVGYNIGLLFAPGLSLEVDTGDCTSEGGAFDVNASLMIRIR